MSKTLKYNKRKLNTMNFKPEENSEKWIGVNRKTEKREKDHPSWISEINKRKFGY